MYKGGRRKICSGSYLVKVGAGVVINLHRLRQPCVLLHRKQRAHVMLLHPAGSQGTPLHYDSSHTVHTTQHYTAQHSTANKQRGAFLTCLHLDAAARVLLLALGFVRGLVAGGARAGEVGVGGQVAAGDERAHVDVVGEDVVADQLAEQQHQVGELHPLTLVSRLG